MTQENKELLLKDLCGRLPYRPYVMVEGYYGQLMSIELSDKWLPGVITTTLARFEYNPENIKPYLRRMSSMTEEEAKEIAILHEITDILSIKLTDEYIDITVDDGFCSTERRIIWYDEIVSSIEIFDWLNKNHFDYRGLIPNGLAIEVTEKNNPYKD